MQQSHSLTPAALYARVSSDRQDVDLSVAAQLRALRDYAKNNGYSVDREYVDEAESGRIADRPQFRNMIDEGGKATAPFQVILVWKFSRFTRKREHAVAFKSMLRRKGIRVVSITEHADDYPHRQADGGHHRERGRILLGKSCSRSCAGYAGSRVKGLLPGLQGTLRLQPHQGQRRGDGPSHPGG